MLRPEYLKYKSLFQLNQLAFQTKYDIINSQNIQKILPPFPSFLDKRNSKGGQNYLRYCLQSNYISFPNICLDAVLGLTGTGQPEVILPNNLEDIVYYATIQGTPITVIQNRLIKSIFKYGLGGILVTIPEGTSIATTLPKLEVIQGNKILDYQYYTDQFGIKKLSYITVDASRYLYNQLNKNYSYTKIYKVHGLDFEGKYYIAEVLAQSYQTFPIGRPQLNDGVISIIYPSWSSELDFIPFTAVSKFDTQITFGPSIIQDLIDISLQNFRLQANLCWLEANAAASHLVVTGDNLDDCSQYPVGAGAVHILNDSTAKEYYVTPSVAGMSEIREHIQQNNQLANQLMYSLTNVAANSSGEALKIRLSSKFTDLVALVKNIGVGITLALEQVDKIVNNGVNKDIVQYVPYIDFANIKTYLEGQNTSTTIDTTTQQSEQNITE